MVSDLFFSQLVLVALVWLCLLLQWAWPSDAASRNPLQASPPSRTVTPVSTPPTLARTPPRLRPRVLYRRGDDDVRSTPRRTFARTRTVPIGAGWAGAISGPTAIPVAGPGANGSASPVVAPFSRPSAPSFTASGPR